jgi:DNA-binding SARP family transcriptional activator/tetratricopeptide (TPR) repeat protein
MLRRGDPVEFRILGPLEVFDGSEPLDLGGMRQHVVLATLLLSAGSVVPTGRLQEAIYGEDLPPTSRSQVHIAISALRRLFAVRGYADAIVTQGNGYVLRLADGWLDSRRFDELVAGARRAADAGRLEEAVAGYRDGERLWRGPALEGIDSVAIEAAAARLDEQRIAAREDRLALELDLGRHHEIAGELTELVRAYPLRERLRAQLMLALYRCDRAAEALQAYQHARRTMVDELGIEPGSRLQQLEREILTGDPALDPPAGHARVRPPAGPVQPAMSAVPRLLPGDIADFTGRAEQVEQIRRGLSAGPGALAGGVVPIVVITGQGGVGKTSLAVHAAHALAGDFPDGQLFADLHGATSHPVGPAQALDRFLRALGVPGAQVPDGLDERAEMFRNGLAGKRVLLVLDDASRESQVTPLLPGTASAAVIVTSRSRLAGLPGACQIDVRVFDPAVSLDLLGRIVGTERVGGQRQAAAAVAEQCGYLPLALRIAGARLSARPHWSVGQLAQRLADETRRLDELRHGDLHVRASISLSYEGVGEDARRLFRLLGVLESPVFSGWMSAPLLDMQYERSMDLLDDLVSAQLVESTGDGSGALGLYRFHDLIRAFAREHLAGEETAVARQAALQRVLGAMLHVAEQVRAHVPSGHVDLDRHVPRWPMPDELISEMLTDTLAWLDRERPALVAGVHQAAHAGLAGLCWNLASVSETFFDYRDYVDDLLDVCETALQASRKAGDLRGTAAMLLARGEQHWVRQRIGSASRDLEAALRLFRESGDDHGAALAMYNLASVARLAGRADDARAKLQQALSALRAAGDAESVAHVLQKLAQLALDGARPDEARELLAEALALCQGRPMGRVAAQVRFRLGETELLRSQPGRAAEWFEQALVLVRAVGDVAGEAYVLQGLGLAKVRQGDLTAARAALLRAAEVAEAAGDRMVHTQAHLGQAELELADGHPDAAVVICERVVSAFRDMGVSASYEVRAFELLREAHAALGDVAAARSAAGRAAELRNESEANPPPAQPEMAG